MRLFLPILNAVHAEGVEFYAGMTPVNTFRVLFNSLFGGQFDLRPDASYLLEQRERSWQFVDACQVFPTCGSLGADPGG